MESEHGDINTGSGHVTYRLTLTCYSNGDMPGYYSFRTLEDAREQVLPLLSQLPASVGIGRIYRVEDGERTLIEKVHVTYNREDCMNYVPFRERRRDVEIVPCHS